MQKTKKLTGKQVAKLAEAAANQAFKVHANYVQFSIWDVGKVLDAGRNAYVNSIGMGEDAATATSHANSAVADAVAKYRVSK